MRVSFYIIPHSVPFVKNFFEIFFIASFKATSASVQLQGFALLYLSDNDVYITTILHLCQHFFILFTYFFEIQPAVMATFALYDLMALFAQKCNAPPAVAKSSRLIDTVNLQ